MLIAEYGLGIGVNLYVEVPAADHGHGIATALGQALTSQPATLAVIVGAAVSGASFASSSRDAASMAMAMLTGVALLCYLGNLFVVRVGADAGATIRSDNSNL